MNLKDFKKSLWGYCEIDEESMEQWLLLGIVQMKTFLVYKHMKMCYHFCYMRNSKKKRVHVEMYYREFPTDFRAARGSTGTDGRWLWRGIVEFELYGQSC